MHTNKTSRVAWAALVAFLFLMPVGGAGAWSEFGLEKEKEPEETSGPEIREPFFHFLLHMAGSDSLGVWTGEELRAHAAAQGRPSRFPLETVVSLMRARPEPGSSHRYDGAVVTAVWTLILDGSQDHPMPYSILGYHPGSLRFGGLLVLSELGPSDLTLTYQQDDEQVSRSLTDVRVFPLETGYVLLDADGFLDALLGSALDDAWTLGFVIGREEGRLIGLGVSLGRKGRHIFGEFDFTADKVLVHGRPPMAALSRASRRWLNVESGNLPTPWIEE